MKTYLPPIAVAGTLLVLAATSAQAVVISTGGGPSGGVNVLFNETRLDETGLTVEGSVNNFIIDFTSTTSLSTPAQGQARIAAEAENGTFTNFLVAPEGNVSFTRLQFNINAAEDGSVSFLINGADFGVNFDLDGNGENRFTFQAQGDEVFNTIAFVTTSAPVEDVRQVRIGGLAAPTNDVPEGGSTLALLGIVLRGLRLVRNKLA